MTTDACVRGLAEGWLDSSFRGDEWAQPTAGVAILRGMTFGSSARGG